MCWLTFARFLSPDTCSACSHFKPHTSLLIKSASFVTPQNQSRVLALRGLESFGLQCCHRAQLINHIGVRPMGLASSRSDKKMCIPHRGHVSFIKYDSIPLPALSFPPRVSTATLRQYDFNPWRWLSVTRWSPGHGKNFVSEHIRGWLTKGNLQRVIITMENHQLSLYPPTKMHMWFWAAWRRDIPFLCVWEWESEREREKGPAAKCSQVSVAINVFIAPSHTRMEHYFWWLHRQPWKIREETVSEAIS